MTSHPVERGLLHHIELWIPDLSAARSRWEWLRGQLGYKPFQSWEHGVTCRLGPTYVVLEQSPAMTHPKHERRRPGMNHLAFHVGGALQPWQVRRRNHAEQASNSSPASAGTGVRPHASARSQAPRAEDTTARTGTRTGHSLSTTPPRSQSTTANHRRR